MYFCTCQLPVLWTFFLWQYSINTRHMMYNLVALHVSWSTCAWHSTAEHHMRKTGIIIAWLAYKLALDCLHRQNLQHPHLQSLHREWCDKKRLVKPQMIVEHVPIHKQGKLLYLEGQSPLKIRTDIIIWKQAKMWPVIDNMWPHTYLPCASLLWQRTVYWPHRHACTRVIW